MNQSLQTDLRYPIGKFARPQQINTVQLQEWIGEIEALPENLATAVGGLNDDQLDTRYRPEGWSVRQVVHHLADSHMNSYVRYRLALTEQTPRIKSYDESAWAELPDARTSPIQTSLNLLFALHRRWGLLLRSMSPQQFERDFEHPERGVLRLDTATAMYAWHSRHHVAHITRLRQRSGW